MRNPAILEPIVSSSSSSFTNSSLKNIDINSDKPSIKTRKTVRSSKLSNWTSKQSNSSGSSQAPILKPRSISSNESHSNPDSTNSTTCWFSSSKEIASNTTNLGSNLRKPFLRKQYLLKKSHLGNEINNLIDTKLRLPIDNKAKSSFSNFTSSVNVNNTYHKQSNSVKVSQEKKERHTATTTIILDLEKYNINEKTPRTNLSKNIMVNVPLTPKKYHTFNENDSPSHKETTNTLVIGSQQAPNGHRPNEVILVNKPIAKNNSTVNPNNLKSKPVIRRPPKEFLSATITHKEPGVCASRNGSVERHEDPHETNEHRTTSPVTKSLPSYDEALKRVSSEARVSKQRISSSSVHKSSPTSFNRHEPANQFNQANSGGFSTFYKNRSALPNLPLQSNFRPLLSSPGAHTGQKVYFRPQDLHNRPPSHSAESKAHAGYVQSAILVPPVPTAPARRVSSKNLFADSEPKAQLEAQTSDRTEQSANKLRQSASTPQEAAKSPVPTHVTNSRPRVPDLFGSSATNGEKMPDTNNKIDETITSSFLENLSDSSHTPTTTDNKIKESDKPSGLNEAILTSRPSLNDNNSNQPKASVNNAKPGLNRQNSNDPTLDRPPGRLNYYDSDTNTISEGVMITSNLIKRSNSEYLHKKAKNEEFSDVPDLSDITEGKFDDLELPGAGHRTSTPNLSKRRRSTSMSSSDIKQIKKQIEELEKMYFELLRIIDPEKNSMYSGNGISSSTSLSSFNASQSRSDTKTKNSKKMRRNKSDLNHLKHRFGRMETHLTSLAKTVAQISLELKSIKSIEEVIYALGREVQDLKRIHMKKSNETDENNFLDYQRSSSEPNLINSILNDNLKQAQFFNCPKQTKSSYSLADKKTDNQEDRQKQMDKNRSFGQTFSNPKKLKKLTKFFGQEPPMLRLFLQKLNYEMYAPNFEHEHITITELPYLSEERLKSLGIPLGPRLRIMKEAQLSFRMENFNYSSV